MSPARAVAGRLQRLFEKNLSKVKQFFVCVSEGLHIGLDKFVCNARSCVKTYLPTCVAGRSFTEANPSSKPSKMMFQVNNVFVVLLSLKAANVR